MFNMKVNKFIKSEAGTLWKVRGGKTNSNVYPKLLKVPNNCNKKEPESLEFIEIDFRDFGLLKLGGMIKLGEKFFNNPNCKPGFCYKVLATDGTKTAVGYLPQGKTLSLIPYQNMSHA